MVGTPIRDIAQLRRALFAGIVRFAPVVCGAAAWTWAAARRIEDNFIIALTNHGALASHLPWWIPARLAYTRAVPLPLCSRARRPRMVTRVHPSARRVQPGPPSLWRR